MTTKKPLLALFAGVCIGAAAHTILFPSTPSAVAQTNPQPNAWQQRLKQSKASYPISPTQCRM